MTLAISMLNGIFLLHFANTFIKLSELNYLHRLWYLVSHA